MCCAVACVGLGGFTTCGVFAPQPRGGGGGEGVVSLLQRLKKRRSLFFMWSVELLLGLYDDASAMRRLSVGGAVLSLSLCVIEEDTSACVHQPSAWSTHAVVWSTQSVSVLFWVVLAGRRT